MVGKKLFVFVCSLALASCRERPMVNSNTTSSDDWMVHYGISYSESALGGVPSLDFVRAGVTLGKNSTMTGTSVQLMPPAGFTINNRQMEEFDPSKCYALVFGLCDPYNYEIYFNDLPSTARMELKDKDGNVWINNYELPFYVNSLFIPNKITCEKISNQVECKLDDLISKQYKNLLQLKFTPVVRLATPRLEAQLTSSNTLIVSQSSSSRQPIDCKDVSFKLSFESYPSLKSTPPAGGDLYVEYNTKYFSISCD